MCQFPFLAYRQHKPYQYSCFNTVYLLPRFLLSSVFQTKNYISVSEIGKEFHSFAVQYNSLHFPPHLSFLKEWKEL